MTDKSPNPNKNSFIQYASLGFQMIAFMVIFGYLGDRFDSWIQSEDSYGLMVGLLFGVVGSTIYLIRTINRTDQS
jgi:F0F1-type ATP synthase assembly protein I